LGIGIYVSLLWIDNNGEHRNPYFGNEFTKALNEMFVKWGNLFI